MYKRLLIIATLALISACAGNSKDDEQQLIAAEESYNEASALINKARSYKLELDDAESKLSQAGILISEEKYADSIILSDAAGDLATDAIRQYEDKQAQAKIRSDKLAEDERLAAAEKLRNESAQKHVVKDGDSLWGIAKSSSTLNNDPLLWPIIFADNQSVINDPDLISPEMTLTIIKTTDVNRLNKARSHAQRRGSWSLGSREDSDQNYLQQQ
jgi:nucleoid-associated protein YgaU